MNRTHEQQELVLPVLCKLWYDSEDETWNGVAEHLAVAVFGDSFEQTLQCVSVSAQIPTKSGNF